MRRIPSLFLASLLLGAPSAALADAAASYKAECSRCHGADGKGDTPVGRAMKVSDISGAEVKGMDEAALAKAILENDKHTALKGKISAEQAAELAAYLKAGL